MAAGHAWKIETLIINSETLKKKKRAEHIAQVGVKKHQKGKRYGKGKLGTTTTWHLSTRCKLASNSTIGIKDKLLCPVQDGMCWIWCFASCCYIDQLNDSGLG